MRARMWMPLPKFPVEQAAGIVSMLHGVVQRGLRGANLRRQSLRVSAVQDNGQQVDEIAHGAVGAWRTDRDAGPDNQTWAAVASSGLSLEQCQIGRASCRERV